MANRIKKPGRDWGPTGIGRYLSPRLSEARREQIDMEITHHEVAIENREPFFTEIAESISRFDMMTDLSATSRPAAVRENLKRAHKASVTLSCKLIAIKEADKESRPAAISAAKKLMKTIGKLDGNSRHLLDCVVPGGFSKICDEAESITECIGKPSPPNASNLILWFWQATTLADQYPIKGRLPENQRLFLAADVADAIEAHLGATVTGTRAGLFESVLSLVLEEALHNAKEVEAVHALVERCIRQKPKRKNPDGSVEYVPD